MTVAFPADLGEFHSVGDRTRERTVSAQQCPGLVERGIRLCGLSNARPGFRFVRHQAPLVQVLACVGGRGQVLVAGRWQPCRAGQAYVTPAGLLHAYEALASWDVVWAFGDFAVAVDCPSLLPCDAGALAAIVDGLHHEAWGEQDATALAAWAGLLGLQLQRAAGFERGDDRLARLWKAVSADLAAPWTCGDLARRLAVSQEHLRRLCVERYGLSPMRRLAELRMQQAANLLRGTELDVQAVAQAVGYENPFAFSTAFKRWAACSPSAFRARLEA